MMQLDDRASLCILEFSSPASTDNTWIKQRVGGRRESPRQPSGLSTDIEAIDFNIPRPNKYHELGSIS
jgi:hypothetical protein